MVGASSSERSRLVTVVLLMALVVCVLTAAIIAVMMACRPEAPGDLPILVERVDGGAIEVTAPVCQGEVLTEVTAKSESGGRTALWRPEREGDPARLVVLRFDDGTVTDAAFNLEEVAPHRDSWWNAINGVSNVSLIIIETPSGRAVIRPGELGSGERWLVQDDEYTELPTAGAVPAAVLTWCGARDPGEEGR